VIPLAPDVERIVDAIYPPQRQAIAVALSSLGIKVFIAASALELALLLGFFYSGAAAALRDAIGRRLKNPLAATASFAAVAYAGLALLMLPLDWYGGYTIPHAFGLSRESPATWLHDWALADLLTLIVVVLAAAAFGTAVRRLGRAWPIAAVAVMAPLIVFGNAIFPSYIAPLFNTYTRMPSSPLTASILALAAREGIDASAVYEYDISLQSTESDAFVSGLGPTARIAVGDNLIKDFRPDEVLYVIAHEMGHYKLLHIWWGSLYAWLGSIVAIALVALAGPAVIGAVRSFQIRGLDDPAALPSLAALLLVFAIVVQPVANAISRHIEHAADAFAASQTNLGDAGIRAFARLGADDLSVLHPQPFVVWYFSTHPPIDERIEYAAEHR
jgi:STE24 endopeptidase